MELPIGVQAKIARANEHLNAYITDAQAFTERNPYRIVAERNAQARVHVLHLFFKEQPDFIRWGTIIGDCLNNLRSALDHMLYELAIADTGQDPPPKEGYIQFPIAETADEFARMRRRISMVSPDIQTAIERLQSYHQLQRLYRHPLLLLSELNNLDKHRLLHLATFQPEAIACDLSGFVRGGRTTVNRNLSALKDRAPILTILTPYPEPNLHVKFEASFFVAIRHRPGPGGDTHSGVDWLLEVVRDEVQSTVNSLNLLFPVVAGP